MSQLKILLVDEVSAERRVVREKLTATLTKPVFLEASTFAEARAIIGEERPDILIIEIVSGGGFRPGMQLVADMRERYPEMRTIVYSRETMRGIADAATRMGATAFVPKSSGVPNELADTVKAYSLPN